MNNWFFFLFFFVLVGFRNPVDAQQRRIVLELEAPINFKKDSLTITAVPISFPGIEISEANEYKVKLVNNHMKWVFMSDTPVRIIVPQLFGNIVFFVEPGDSIVTFRNQNNFDFGGIGSEKFKIQYDLELNRKQVPRPEDKKDLVNDYLLLSKYVDTIIEKQNLVLNTYRNDISDNLYRYFKNNIFQYNNYIRLNSFARLIMFRNERNLTSINLVNLYDSTIGRNKFEDFSNEFTYPSRFDFFIRIWNTLEYSRIKQFKEEFLSIPHLDRQFELYEYVVKKYNGLFREKLIRTILSFDMIRYHGITEKVMEYVDNYLNMSGYDEYKNWMKKVIVKAKTLSTGEYAPNFELPNSKGEVVSLSDFNGKVVLVDFWFSGCTGCKIINPIMKSIEKEFVDNSNVVFVNISVDKEIDKWKYSLDLKKYTTGDGINLYTNGKGQNHPVIDAYNITSYPHLFLVDPSGVMVSNPLPDPRLDQGKSLSKLIRQELIYQNDGPYVFYKNDSIISKSIVLGSGRKELLIEKASLKDKQKIKISINANDSGKTFSFSLKKDLKNEPCMFIKPKRMLILSDIEGNFTAFCKLLLNNGVIDEKYDWAFGDGHLILVGDVFDRGKQVTECLWLIYYLEERAKACGGYVHFILGNHEIMNLNNNTKYVQSKYLLDNTILLNESYVNLYNENTELGKWLRTKNIVEKIGDFLLVHGGISNEVNNLPLSIDEINNRVRPYYSLEMQVYNSSDRMLKTLFDNEKSPFWYRGYYEMIGQDSSYYVNQINKTLNKYEVKKIITGHTIVDSVSAFFEDKVINVDTHHAKGKSEALLIDGNNIYRVNAGGKKNILLTSKNNSDYIK